MKNLEILEKFCSELLDGAAGTKSFDQICESIGERASRVDACLREYVGVEGKIVTECFRLNVPASLLKKDFTPDCASRPH